MPRVSEVPSPDAATVRAFTEPMRLHVFLARSGVLSRQKNKSLVREGRVRVNDSVVLEPFVEVDPQHDRIAVDGEPVALPRGFTYVLMNKPRGHICAFADPEGRPTLAQYFPPEMPVIHPVGRLDYNTEGALLLTDDGELAHRIIHPDFHLPKVYRVKIRGHLRRDEPAFEKIREGVVLDGEKTLPMEVEWETERTRATWIRMVLREGRFRQIRRTCDLFGWQIVKLHRVAIGPITLDDELTPRTWRLLRGDEVHALASAVGLERDEAHMAAATPSAT
jgi:pseudouridine synthase